MASPMELFFSFLILMAALKPVQAVQYQVFNNVIGTPGGTRFNNEIGIPYSQQTLELASDFIWQTFKQGEGDRKNIEEIIMMVEGFQGIAYLQANYMHVSSEYIASYIGDVRIEIIRVLYHETTHVWQWFGNGEAPIGLIEGIADYVRLKARWVPLHWPKEGLARDGMTDMLSQLTFLSIVMASEMVLLLILMVNLIYKR